jgi:hypothetical protein
MKPGSYRSDNRLGSCLRVRRYYPGRGEIAESIVSIRQVEAAFAGSTVAPSGDATAESRIR